MGKYRIVCGDCRKTYATSDNVRDSYAGGTCPACKRKRQNLRKLKGASTAPSGYEWYSNGKSRFAKSYKSVLKEEGFKI